METVLVLIPWLIMAIFVIIPAWRILHKACFVPAISLALIVPLLGWFCVLVVLAFVQWPSLKRPTNAEIASAFE